MRAGALCVVWPLTVKGHIHTVYHHPPTTLTQPMQLHIVLALGVYYTPPKPTRSTGSRHGVHGTESMRGQWVGGWVGGALGIPTASPVGPAAPAPQPDPMATISLRLQPTAQVYNLKQ